MNEKELQPLLELSQIVNFNKIFMLIVAIAALVALVKLIQKLGSHLQQYLPSYRLLILQITTIISFFIYIFGITTVTYSILKPPNELLLAIGGSAAVAIGFAFKDIVGSFVAGVVLLFDRPFQVGDRVKFEDVYGEIKSINLRSVRMQTLDDNIITIPNTKFFNEIVSSGNFGALDMMVTTDFHVSLDSDLDEVQNLLYEIVTTSRFAYLKKPVSIVASEVSLGHQLAIKLTVKAYVLDVKYEKEFQTSIVARATHAFVENDIARPSSTFSELSASV